MRRYGYLVVEGPHDVEFCYRLIREKGLVRVKQIEELDTELKALVPAKFPHAGDLLKRVPVPLFMQDESFCLAIHSAVGDSRLVATLQETLAALDKATFKGVGLLLDADSAIPPTQRYDGLRQRIEADIGLDFPDSAGKVSTGAPNTGAFVLPDNTSQGTLEDLLLESASVQYSRLYPIAEGYVDRALAEGLIPVSHRDEIRKPAGRNKAIVGALSSLFRPGKSVQTSIQDNDWVRGAALAIPRIQAVHSFLAQLFELSTAPAPSTVPA